jgi:hypothetical protein
MQNTNEDIARCEESILRHDIVIETAISCLNELEREIVTSMEFIVACEDSSVGLTAQMATDYMVCKASLMVLHAKHKILSNDLKEKKVIGEFLAYTLEHLFAGGSDPQWAQCMQECSNHRLELMTEARELRAELALEEILLNDAIRDFSTGVEVQPM